MFATVLLLACRVGLATEASSAPTPLDAEGREIRVAGVLVTTLQEPARAVLPMGVKVYVLSSGGVLQVWEAGPTSGTPVYKLVSSTPIPEAVGLFAAGGHVWAEVRETRAIPVDAAAPGVTASTGEAASSSSEIAAPGVAGVQGKVLQAENGTAIIDLGRKDGLTPGDFVRFLGEVEVLAPHLDGSGSDLRKVEREVATGSVRLLEDNRALVDLARGGRVAEGDRVELRTKGHAWPVAPERLGGVGETGIVVRPLLALDTLGVAFINEAWTTWSFERPWYVSARLSPLATGWSRDGNPITISALATGGYEGRYFSVGLGAGWTMLNEEPGSNFGATDYSTGGIGEQVSFKDVDSVFAVVQEARLGSRDGVYASIRNTFILYPRVEYTWNGVCDSAGYTGDYGTDCYDKSEKANEFLFGGIAMRFGVPVGDRTDLLVDWGTGDAGATWVEGGVATWLHGNGDEGSLGLEVGAGYGSLSGLPDDENVTLGGPLLSVGARWRW